jgi:periplasmic protein TonB
MAIDHYSIFAPVQNTRATKTSRLLRPVKNDVALEALLEEPVRKEPRRSPLEWLGAMGFHAAIVAALIIIPLFTTATIQMTEYVETPLVAPPPAPAPPPPPPAAGPAPSHIAHPEKPKLNFTMPKLRAPIEMPKKVSSGSNNLAESAPAIAGGVPGGITGGVSGGVLGGVVGGVTGGTGPAAPTPPPAAKPVKAVPKLVHVGGNIRAPRQTYSVEPVYPPLARQTRVWGTVVVDAVIDEHGNVVQERVVSGHPLLIEAALQAVRQWKFAPTTLNGQPISVEMQVQVHFNLNSPS